MEQTTQPMIHPVSSLLLNATWKAPRKDTDFIWTTLGHANVSIKCSTNAGLYGEIKFVQKYLFIISDPFSSVIPPCVDTELVQFPLRMRDWLKNVLLQLYEHDSMSPGFLTPKQRFRVSYTGQSEYEELSESLVNLNMTLYIVCLII